MEEQNLEAQNPTGDQSGAGDNQEKNGGPSDEQKMLRLERELAEAKEREARYKSAYEQGNQGSNDGSDDDDNQFSQERDSFYREKAQDAAVREIGAEIDKLPKPLQERIKNDPFNSAWTDPKILEYELIGVDLNDPKAKMEAAKRAAIKSIPQFAEGFSEKQESSAEQQGFGNNPPLDQGNSFSSGGKGLEFLSDEELQKIASMGK
jgi:hypothetical protein